MESNEILASIKDATKRRMITPVYGVFTLSWLALHWQIIYAAFFVSEDKIWQSTHMLRNEYIHSLLINFSDPWFYVSWILPFILTWLIIWEFPKYIGIPAFKKDQEDLSKKARIQLEEQTKLESETLAKLRATSERKKEEKEIIKTEKEIERIDPRAEWKQEYDRFSKTTLFNMLSFIVAAIYDYQGRVRVYDQFGDKIEFQIPQNILVYADTNGLIQFKSNLVSNTETIELTEKGRFFVKEYSSGKSLN